MANTEVVKPDGNLATTGWSVGGWNPGLSHWQAIAEAPESLPPYPMINTLSMILTSAGGSPADCRFTMGTYTLAATERCRRARLKTVGEVAVASTQGRSLWGSGGETLDGNTWSDLDPTLKTGPWYSSYNGVAYSAPNEWTQARIDALQCRGRVNIIIDPSGQVFIHDMFVELEIMKEADATWLASTLHQDVAINPTIGWTFIGNGESQKLFHVKVFTLAQTLAGGFDPDVTVPVYNSGQVTSSASSQKVTTNLTPGGEYVPYLKVAKDFNGTDWWKPSWIVGGTFKVTNSPSVTGVGPTGIIDTNKPTVSWTFNHNNISGAPPQVEREVRLYQEPGGGWPGVGGPGDPAWDAAVGASLMTVVEASSSTSLATSTIEGVSLPNSSNFRAYVKAAKADPEAPAVRLWSAWAFSDFTTDFDEPPTPTISVAADPAKLVDVLIDVTATAPGVGQPDTDYYNLYRSIDGGPYEAFYIDGGQSSLGIAGPASFQARDSNAPLHKLLSYRVESVTTDLGVPVSSPFVSDDTTLDVDQVWLKMPSDPSMDRRFLTEDKWLSINVVRARRLSVALGRRKPLVVRGDAKYLTLAVTFLILGSNTKDDLDALLDADQKMFLQTPKGSWYVELSAEVTELTHLWDSLRDEEDAWRVTLPFTEVDA